MASHPNGPPPFFAPAHESNKSSASKATTGRSGPQLNLDDIFGDVVFTPDGDTVFLSEQNDDEILNSGEKEVTTMASKPAEDGQFKAVSKAGGLYTTDLHDGSKPALTMGALSEGVQQIEAVPFKHAPQLGHHLQYAAPKKKSKDRSGKMNDQQKTDRRYVKMLGAHRCPTFLHDAFSHF
jgi:hypothetical protein